MKEGMAQRIKVLRQEKGLTLEQVADVVGVGKSTVRKWETGMIANMKRDKIADLAKALGTTPAYLMGWDEDNVENEEKKESPSEPQLTGVDKELWDLLKRIPEDKKKMFLQLGRVFEDNLNKE